MNGTRVDALARALAGGASRRGVLAALAAGLAAALGMGGFGGSGWFGAPGCAGYGRACFGTGCCATPGAECRCSPDEYCRCLCPAGASVVNGRCVAACPPGDETSGASAVGGTVDCSSAECQRCPVNGCPPGFTCVTTTRCGFPVCAPL